MNNICSKACKFFEDTNPSSREINYALLAMRIAVGLFFVTFGYGKLFGAPGLDAISGLIASIGFPIPGVFALLVGVAEFFGGIAIILGVFTRFSAFWLMIITLVAWATVKGFSFGFGAEGNFDLLALGLTMALFFTGPGAMSVSGQMRKE